MIQKAIQKVVEKKDLTLDESKEVFEIIMSGRATDAQIAGFLIALRMKGETVDEITGAALIMRAKASSIHPKVSGLIVDTCGTGGDKKNTFNISTTAAFVISGAGIAVAKHGNRSVSSKSGSADVLKSLGINIDLTPEKVEKCIEEIGMGFMFAPVFHGAMKHAINARRELGVRTIFNILGPLTNPANADSQVIGVYDENLIEKMAEVLKNLGVKHAFIVHGNGLDEITTDGVTKVCELKDGVIKKYEITPTDLGFKISSNEDLLGNSPDDNANITINILKGIDKSAKRDIVVLNAAAAIVAAGKAKDFKEGIIIAQESIDSGNAFKKLESLKEFTNR